MKRDIIKRLKAIVLLTVFTLNTAIGFACTVGLDKAFDGKHQHKISIGAADHHHEGKADYKSSKSEKDKCCHQNVAKFEKTDKQTSRFTGISFPVFVFTAPVPFYQAPNALALSIHMPNKWYFVQCHHPPIHDIRIAVQSFQI